MCRERSSLMIKLNELQKRAELVSRRNFRLYFSFIFFPFKFSPYNPRNNATLRYTFSRIFLVNIFLTLNLVTDFGTNKLSIEIYRFQFDHSRAFSSSPFLISFRTTIGRRGILYILCSLTVKVRYLF